MAGEPQMTTKQQLFLFALQSAFGSATTALTASDFLDVEDGADLENALTPEEVTSAEGKFGQRPRVIGDMSSTCTLPMIMRTNGDNDPGYWSKPFKCSGMKETPSSKVYTYSVTSLRTDWKDGTLWHYTGSQVASGALLEKASNVITEWEITLTPGKVAKISFSGVGAHSGAPTAATQPTPTNNTTVAKAVLAATITLMGYAYKPLEIKIKATREMQSTVDASATYGHGRSMPGDLKITWTAKLYAVLPSETDAFTQLLAGTLGAFSVMWGTAPNKFTISSPNTKAQIISRKKSDQNGITTIDLEGIFVDNDFQIVVDTTP
jgi:hypothetical protein